METDGITIGLVMPPVGTCRLSEEVRRRRIAADPPQLVAIEGVDDEDPLPV
jgi:hypothetical protein